MRRHPTRLSPRDQRYVESGGSLKREVKNTPKRGPKNKRRLWPTLDYYIMPVFGVIFRGLP